MQQTFSVPFMNGYETSNPMSSVVWVPCVPDYSTGALVPLYTLQNYPFNVDTSTGVAKISRGGLKSKPWTHEEDAKLEELVKTYGVKGWAKIAKAINECKGTEDLRKGKHCRERWLNHLNPEINKGEWSYEEDLVLLTDQTKIGNSWSKIAKKLKGRTENAVKNRWNSLIKIAKQEMNLEYLPNQAVVEILIKQITDLNSSR